MDIRQYLLSIITAAMICGIISVLFQEKKGSYAKIIKLISGIFLMFTVISPLGNVELTGFGDYTDTLKEIAEESVEEGVTAAAEERNAIIKQQTEAYILEKATSLGAQITVEVHLSDDSIPYPNAAVITGSVSPYDKAALVSYISTNLNIPEDSQIWI